MKFKLDLYFKGKIKLSDIFEQKFIFCCNCFTNYNSQQLANFDILRAILIYSFPFHCKFLVFSSHLTHEYDAISQ